MERVYKSNRPDCPLCGKRAHVNKTCGRTLHDVGDRKRDRPVDIVVRFPSYYCRRCERGFNHDTTDLAPQGTQYTHRVIDLAVRLVVEDGLPYRPASWQLWRDHRVFVPFATIQNWVEAAGEKS
jgi:transposase-like protein